MTLLGEVEKQYTTREIMVSTQGGDLAINAFWGTGLGLRLGTSCLSKRTWVCRCRG